tara:strand:- start:2724 stop:5516 length:2793 start_codon:yes stop_codon:yes gene_type:complete
MATLEELEDALITAGESGNTKATASISDAMRAHPTFQGNAKEKLDSGSYGLDANLQHLGKDEKRAEMSKYMARSMGLKDSEVDVTQGMGTYGRFKLSFQPTEKDKVKHLEDTYGRENIQATEVGGKMKLLYRDEQETGGQFRAVDEEGVSLADFFGDTAGTAAPIAGAVGAAVATGGASIPLLAGASALGGLAASVGQDTAVRAASGEDLQLGESLKRRGIEAAIGVPIDLVTGVGGKLLTQSLSKRAVDKTTGSVLKAIDDVNLRYSNDVGQIEATTAMEIGEQSAKEESVRAGFGGAPHKQLENIRIRSAQIRDVMRGKQAPKDIESAFAGYVDDVNEQLNIMRASKDKAVVDMADIIDQKIANNAGRLKPKTAAGQAQRGDSIQGAIQDAVARKEGGKVVGGVEFERGKLYGAAYGATEGAGVSLPSLESAVQAGLGDMNLPRDMTGDVINLLGERVGKNAANIIDDLTRMHGKGSTLTVQQVDDYLQGIAKDAKLHKTGTLTPTERNARALHANIKALRDKVIDEQAPAARPLFKSADDHFQKKVLPARELDVDKILSTEASGAYSHQGEQVIDAALNSTRAVKQILKVTGNDSAVKKTLRDAYLERISANPQSLSWDDDIVTALWGSGKVKSLRKAQAILKGRKLAMSSKTEAAFNKAMGAMDDTSRNKALNELKKAHKADTDLAEALKKKLIRAVREDKVEINSKNAGEFVDTMNNSSPAEINAFYKAVENGRGGVEAKEAFQQASFDRLQSITKGSSPQRAGKHSESLWTPELMDAQLKGASGKRWEALLGKDQVKDLRDLNTIIRSASEPKVAAGEIGARTGGSIGQGGFTPYVLVSGSIPKWAWRKVINVAYGSKMLKPLVKALDPENVTFDDALFKKIMPAMLATQRGAKALGDEMDADPEFESWMENQMAGGESPQASQ